MEISLALGGGGVRGVAHIGVLRALEHHGFEVKAIAGTSAGGLVGAVYAAGYSTERIEEAVKELDQNRSFHRQSDDQPSLIGLSSIAKKLSELLSDRTFDELEIPYAATAVSLHSGKEIILREGKVLDAVLATIAIPGIFPSQEIGGRVLIDGGVMDPVPVQVARWMRPDLPVVAVMLHELPDDFDEGEISLPIQIPGPSSFIKKLTNLIVEKLTNLRPVQALNIFSRSMEVTSIHLTRLSMRLYQPEVIIAPKVGHIGILQDIQIDEMIQEGIDATEMTMIKIKEEANWSKKIQRQVKHFVNPDPHPVYWGNVED